MTHSLASLADGIRAHLQRFANDPDTAEHKWTDAAGKAQSSASYWNPNAARVGSRLAVTYVSYQGPSTMSKAEAGRYLAWLDAGNVGKHWQALREANHT